MNAFSALLSLVEQQKGHLVCKNLCFKTPCLGMAVIASGQKYRVGIKFWLVL